MFFSPHGLGPAEEESAAILLRAVMRDHDIAAWADAVEVEQALRNGVRGIRGEVLLHRSYATLDEADISKASDRGQFDLWPNECEGMWCV